ncbi:ABC transporter permease [Intrasporangium flavum]|uniref:ABC transporter permease n=1 Tax=Intrasporangium flavum TaxID=1428657 RepID=UPI0009FA19C7|nr:ABC transporter permease [Intrasporangium flavum]
MTTTSNRSDRRDAPATRLPAHDGVGRAWTVVAMREVVVRLTNRAFLVSTALTLLFIAGYGAFAAWQSGRTTTWTVAVSTTDAPAAGPLVAATGRVAHTTDDTVVVTTKPVADASAARTAVTDGDADVWLHRTATGWAATSADDVPSGLRTALEQAVRTDALDRNATAAGTSLTSLEQGSALSLDRFSGAGTDAGFVKAVTFAFALLFFMSAMMFGQQIAASVVEEKQSRLVEIIATAIPVRQLLAGKVVGNSAIALAQVVLIAGVGLVMVSFTDFSALLPTLSTAVVWFVLFFAVGFFALACLFAVAGALASRTEDLQSTTAPMTTVLMLVYVVSFGLSGTALTVASYVPVASVVTMPARILAGDATWWEAVLSLLVMVVFSAATVVVGERIYRRSLLQTRGRVSWRQALRATD